MSERISKFGAFLPGLVLWASGTVALADDTEILTGQIGDYAAPNILFIIDTSGSMDGQVLIDDGYDPAVTYPGPFDVPDRLYYTLADFGGGFNFPDADYIDFGFFVSENVFVCDAARMPLEQSGFYVDRIIQFDTQDDRWGFLEDDDPDPALSGSRRFTECFRDYGIHGTNDASDGAYPVNEDGLPPFTTDPDDEDAFDWSGYQLTYAVFSNNYLNWIASRAASGDPVLSTRLGVVQDVTRNLIDRLVTVNDPRQAFNLGLMRFSTNAEGGIVLQPVANVATSRDEIVAAVDSMSPFSNTPLAETLYEAYQYLRGGPVVYGLNSTPTTSVASSRTPDGSNYISPIEASCQKNYIVLLTDGLPTSDNDANGAIQSIVGGACSGASCLDDLAQYLDSADILPGMEEDQTIQTFTIGFFTNSQLLRDTATGEVPPMDPDDPNAQPIPGYFLADNVEELERAFNSIFTQIETDVSTFTAPAASVNSLNRLQNRNILYFTMFQPSSMGQPHWDGNLKAYKIGRENASSELTILDANNRPAITADGIFEPSARSIWSASADGGTVTEGGFASRLGLTRTVVTDVAGSNLFAADNRLEESNTTITKDMLGIPVAPGPTGEEDAEQRRKALLRFASGIAEDGTPIRQIGDPLHTRPLILTYAGGGDDLAVFLSTNDGFLHKLDPTPIDGFIGDLEEWAYMPSELLTNLDVIERNPPALPNATQKLYGLDGPLTAFIEGDTNSIVDPDERVFLYSAMRRGGTSYYALDLGSGGRQNPKLAFKISRGDPGFDRLGQTWSAAEPAKMQIGSDTRDVLVFGGGYDTDHDNNYAESTVGSAIFIVDAKTGDLLWRASSEDAADLTLSDMKYPIPSNVTVLDINQDGLADRMYVGDLGGQVWRFDNIEGDITGARLATLGAAGSVADERRFYNAPAVTRILSRTDSFLAIAIGSGWRAHPLSTQNNDRLYVLKDENVFTPQVDENGAVVYPAPLTNSDLVGLQLDQSADAGQLQGAGGWFLELGASGEKSLSSALIADNRVFFTSYSPESGPLGCQPSAAVGTGRLYALNILTGQPALVNADGQTVSFNLLESGGIPPEPQLVFVEPPCVANCDVLNDGDPDNDDEAVYATGDDNECLNPGSEVYLQNGFEGVATDICTAPVKTYWSESDLPLEDL